MKKILILLLFCGAIQYVTAQKNHPFNIATRNWQKKYVAEHEVVKQSDKKYFRFFPANKAYQVLADFTRITDTVGFTLKTSAGTTKQYFKYGRLDFKINGVLATLFVYQSPDLLKTEQYKDYLFVPFTDASTGNETYGSGRYIDLRLSDISFNSVMLDFNKAYNPYCAYAKGFKCPIPPRENALEIPIYAGEKTFAKSIH